MSTTTATLYNREVSGEQYITNNNGSSKEEQQQGTTTTDKNGQLIPPIPWDNDGFSLCLDTFPASRFARTKYSIYPTIASPLRKHWRNPSLNSNDSADNDQPVSSASSTLSSSQNQTVPTIDDTEEAIMMRNTDQQVTTMTRTKKRIIKFKKALLQIDSAAGPNSHFPYNNNATFLNQLVVVEHQHPHQQYQPKVVLPPPSPSTASSIIVGRVEHISPLLNPVLLNNSSTVLNQEEQYQPKVSLPSSSSTNKSSIMIGRVEYISPLFNSSLIDQGYHTPQLPKASIHSASSSILSIPTHLGGDDSNYIDNCEIPGWKIASSKRRNALSPIVDPLFPPNVVNKVPTPPPHLEPYVPSLRVTSVSNSSHYSHHSQLPSHHSGSYYLPSPSASSYQSISVPKNTDSLIYFSEESPTSPSTIFSSSTIKEQKRHSSFFHPRYHGAFAVDNDGDSEFGGSLNGGGKKKKKYRFGSFQGSNSPSVGGERSEKKSVGLIARLLKNIKTRFAVQQE